MPQGGNRHKIETEMVAVATDADGKATIGGQPHKMVLVHFSFKTLQKQSDI